MTQRRLLLKTFFRIILLVLPIYLLSCTHKQFSHIHPAKEGCLDCHTDIKDTLETARYKHALLKKDYCQQCHDLLSSNTPNLLKAPPEELCNSCHKEFGDNISSSSYVHTPVKQGECTACHDPHGTAYLKLLRDEYSTAFFFPKNAELYNICFDCHDKGIMLKKKTEGITRFKNGDDNLHYLHINNNFKRMTCKACHTTHAGQQPMRIREYIPYGKSSHPGAGMKIRVRFKISETGGVCFNGCHNALHYDRENPVEKSK